MKPAPAIFVGRQQGIGHVPDFDLFTLTEAVGIHPEGSTVSESTLSRHGFHVDAVVRQHPQGGYTHAVASSGAKRIYQGWWSTRRLARLALKAISRAADHAVSREFEAGPAGVTSGGSRSASPRKFLLRLHHGIPDQNC